MTRKRIVLLAASGVVLLILLFLGVQGARSWMAWRGIERVNVDIAGARDWLAEIGIGSSDGERVQPYPDDEYDTVLIIGNDFSAENPDRQEGVYADAVLLWIDPKTGEDPAIVSIPRDLLVVDPCTGQETKIDRTLEGCGEDVSGPELVAIAVEDFTGMHIDHFATLDFQSFVAAIDAMGGVEICVEHALRDISSLAKDAPADGDEKSYAFLQPGCTEASGKTALYWVRSRKTQEYVDGKWRFVEGTSDANRSIRQQTLLFAMLAKLKTMRSPSALAGIVESLGDGVVLDDELSMSEAIAMVWDLRSVPPSRIRRIVIPTEPVAMEDGAFAVRATNSFRELFDG